MHPTDQMQDPSKLSEPSRALIAQRDRILELWGDRVQSRVRAASRLIKPLLLDTLPAFIDNLAESLTPEYPRLHASDSTTIAQEHGGERARLTQYDPEQLIQEYQILHEVLFEVLEPTKTLGRNERRIIHSSVDSAMRDAVTAFALVHADIRERFIATLIHDLRNPIGVIQMAADICFDELDNKRELTMLLTRIIDNAKRAEKMIRDLLDATLIKSGGRLDLEISDCQLLELVSNLIAEQSLVHGKRFRLTGEPVRGYWDPQALRRAVENMISNAVKYGDPRETISLDVAQMAERVQISVHNKGLPIPSEDQETIFQVFRRSYAAKSGQTKGWGIGLALVRGVAESHGGSIIVDSAEDRGTTFQIDLPLDARPFRNAPVTE